MGIHELRIPELNSSDLELIEDLAQAEARESFWKFRQYMNPNMILGHFQWHVSQALQQFYEDLLAGKRPYLVLSAPPQHGKSTQMVEFLAWLAGKNPHARQIYASYSEKLGVRANLTLQRMMDSRKYRALFGPRLISNGMISQVGRYKRDLELLEFINSRGSFRNTTVNGPINGEGLDLGLIDDPIKGRNEAQSLAVRDKVWSWFTDDFFGRFSEYAGMIIIMTRWHIDDPVGRFIERFPHAKVLRYAAIAERDEDFRKAGEALFPEHKSLAFLMERKKLLTQAGWESVWQQNPIIAGGGLFPIDKFEIVPTAPARAQIKKSVRYWDKAGTAGGGAYTVGALLQELRDGRILVADIRRGQWSANEREIRIRQTCEVDRASHDRVETWIEQEPGSGGKESAERTIAELRGFTVRADRVTGAKEIRAEPYAAQVQAGNVLLLAGDWNRAFLDEHEHFPAGKYKDQVDAAAGAFAKVTGRQAGSYDATMSWVD